MAIHLVTQIEGEEFQITLSHDDAGNYVAEAVHLARGEGAEGRVPPHVRVVDPAKERAVRALFASLHRLVDERRACGPRQGPDAPAAA